MDGGRVKVDLSTYHNDMTTFTCRDDVLALLIHLGYLGFVPSSLEEREKGNYGEVFIPNEEVLEVFRLDSRNSNLCCHYENG